VDRSDAHHLHLCANPLQIVFERFAIDWPLEVEIDQVSISLDDWYSGSYAGALIESPSDVQMLRALAPPAAGYDFWPIRNGDSSYCELRARDAIPLEDSAGEILRSWDNGDQ
jgi:hypothetical protein